MRLYDQTDLQGFDEFMNVVLKDSEEVWQAKPATETKPAREAKRKPLGRILLCVHLHLIFL